MIGHPDRERRRRGEPLQARGRRAGERDAQPAQRLGRLQPFIALLLQECTGQLGFASKFKLSKPTMYLQ
jgi:hypothetical protein